MKRWTHAIALLAVLATVVFALQTIHAEPADNPGNVAVADQNDHRDASMESSEVDLGQKRKVDKLTADERWVRKNYPETSATKGQILVFTATWCGPCRRYAPTVNALKGRYNVFVYDYDTKRGNDLYEKLKDPENSAVPTTVILIEGKLKKRFVGPQRLATVEQYAADCRKEKKNDDETKRIDIGPLNIDIDPDGDVDIYWRRRDRP